MSCISIYCRAQKPLGNLPCSVLLLRGLFPDLTRSCLARSLFCFCKYTVAECPVIYSALFVRCLPDAVLLLLMGWLVWSSFAANGLL